MSDINLERLTGGASETASALNQRIIIGQEAYCPFENIKIRKTSELGYIELPILSTDVEFSSVSISSLTGSVVRNAGIDENGTIVEMETVESDSGYSVIRRGWSDQDNVSVVSETIDNGNGTYNGRITVSPKVGDTEYYCDYVKYTLSGSSPAVLTLPDVDAELWIFFIDGVLTATPDFVVGQCPVRLVNWDADDKEFIKDIPQAHGTDMSEATQAWGHTCMGSLVEKSNSEMKLVGFTTDGDGSSSTEYQYYRTAGNYRDEDIRYSLPDGKIWSPVYYEAVNGSGDAVSRRHIPTGVGADQFDSHLYNDTVTGMPYYNKMISEGVYGLGTVPDGKYFMMLSFAFGNDRDEPVASKVYDITVMGQNIYDTLNEARLNVSSEVDRTEGGYDSLQEIATIGVTIYQASSSFTNPRKCKVIPFSTASEKKYQPYYDMTNRNSMETQLITPTPEVGYELLGVWGWTQYSAFYGTCTNNLTTNPNLFDAGTTEISISRNALDGSNLGTVLDGLPADSVFRFENLAGNYVIVSTVGSLVKTTNIYDGVVDSVDATNIGTGFLDSDPILISVQSTGTSLDEKVKTSASDATSGYLGSKISGSSNVIVDILTDGGTGSELVVLDLADDISVNTTTLTADVATILSDGSNSASVESISVVGDVSNGFFTPSGTNTDDSTVSNLCVATGIVTTALRFNAISSGVIVGSIASNYRPSASMLISPTIILTSVSSGLCYGGFISYTTGNIQTYVNIPDGAYRSYFQYYI